MSPSKKLNELTISEAADGLKAGNFTSVELTQACLNQIQKEDSKIKAFLRVFPEKALEEAQKADELLSQKKYRPLLGIPLALKDNILVAGEICTAGSRILQNYTASYDATVVRKLKKQGVVILGKTNLDEFAMGSSTENSGFGPTHNPKDTERVPGGSSGGSAAAVAADMCLGALGSDTGGSIRQPASFCGIVGLKPTYGSVSRHGLIAMASSLDQIGPLAKTVEDASLIFSAIVGGDDFDSTVHQDNFLNKGPEIKSLPELRVGIPKEYFSSGLNPEVEKVVKLSFKKLEREGMKLEEISLPHSPYALAAYYLIVPAEVSANLARFDGIRYGYRSPNHENLLEIYGNSRAEGFGAEPKRRIMLGTYALSAGYYDAYYLKAQKVRQLIRCDFEESFRKVDFLLGPTTPTPAFKFGEKTVNPLQMYLEDIYTVGVNLAGLPAISLPGGTVKTEGKDLPVGLHLIGPWFGEDKLLKTADLMEKVLNPRED